MRTEHSGPEDLALGTPRTQLRGSPGPAGAAAGMLVRQGPVSWVPGIQWTAACADLRLGPGPLPVGPFGQGSCNVYTPMLAGVAGREPQKVLRSPLFCMPVSGIPHTVCRRISTLAFGTYSVSRQLNPEWTGSFSPSACSAHSSPWSAPKGFLTPIFWWIVVPGDQGESSGNRRA